MMARVYALAAELRAATMAEVMRARACGDGGPDAEWATAKQRRRRAPYSLATIGRHLARGYPLFTLGVTPRDVHAMAAKRRRLDAL